MPRQRMHKAERTTDSRFAECSIPARYLYTYLENHCDDYGACPANVKNLKLQIFPGDDITSQNIQEMIIELISAALLEEIESDGKRFWRFLDWDIPESPFHQKIDKPSKIRYLSTLNEGSRVLASGIECSDITPGGLQEDSRGVEPKDKIKEVKLNEKEKVNKKKREGLPDERFEEFWQAFPKSKRVGREKALAQFRRKVPDESMFERVMQAIVDQVVEKDARRRYLGFASEFKDPERWLADERWNDVLETEEQIKSQQRKSGAGHSRAANAWTEFSIEAQAKGWRAGDMVFADPKIMQAVLQMGGATSIGRSNDQIGQKIKFIEIYDRII